MPISLKADAEQQVVLDELKAEIEAELRECAKEMKKDLDALLEALRKKLSYKDIRRLRKPLAILCADHAQFGKLVMQIEMIDTAKPEDVALAEEN